MMGAVSLHERVAALLDRSGALDAAMQVRCIMPISTVSIVTFRGAAISRRIWQRR